MSDELQNPKADEIVDATTGGRPPARSARRRWLVAVAALVLGGTQIPIALRIMRRWNRRSCEFVVDWPAPYASDEPYWVVSLDQYECDFIKPKRLDVMHDGPADLILMVQFQSKGPVNARRRNRLTVEVLDAAGRLLDREASEATDERTWPQPTHYISTPGTPPAVLHPIAQPPFTLKVGHGRPARVRIRFDEDLLARAHNHRADTGGPCVES